MAYIRGAWIVAGGDAKPMNDLVNIAQSIFEPIQHLMHQVLAAAPTTQILILLCFILVFLLILIARTFTKKPVLEVSDAAVVAPRQTPILTDQQASVLNERHEKQGTAEMDNLSDMDDFKIFKRPVSAEAKTQPSTAQPKLQTDDELLVIEQNMIRLRELFHDGHITRDVYIDETRTLYHQAKALVKIA